MRRRAAARRRAALAVLAPALLVAPATAQVEIGRSDFRYVSDLMVEGFVPVPASGPGVITGLSDGTDLYLCFSLDTPEDQAERQRVLLAEFGGGAAPREVPNIPLACVRAQ